MTATIEFTVINETLTLFKAKIKVSTIFIFQVKVIITVTITQQITVNYTYTRGKSGGDHIFVNPELRLKPCLVVIIKNHCTPYQVW